MLKCREGKIAVQRERFLLEIGSLPCGCNTKFRDLLSSRHAAVWMKFSEARYHRCGGLADYASLGETARIGYRSLLARFDDDKGAKCSLVIHERESMCFDVSLL